MMKLSQWVVPLLMVIQHFEVHMRLSLSLAFG